MNASSSCFEWWEWWFWNSSSAARLAMLWQVNGKSAQATVKCIQHRTQYFFSFYFDQNQKRHFLVAAMQTAIFENDSREKGFTCSIELCTILQNRYDFCRFFYLFAKKSNFIVNKHRFIFRPRSFRHHIDCLR